MRRRAWTTCLSECLLLPLRPPSPSPSPHPTWAQYMNINCIRSESGLPCP